jgi:hypothetical protein
MTHSYPDPLALSRRVLRVLIKLNLLMGVLILGLLVTSVVVERPVMAALGAGTPEANAKLFLGMRLVAVIGLCAVPVVHFILTRILAIVDTVSIGNPFVLVNAARLQKIAWAVLTLELMHLAVGAIAASVSTAAAPLDLNWSFSPTRWVAVLLLFVLSRVFEQGAQMREELEATV